MRGLVALRELMVLRSLVGLRELMVLRGLVALRELMMLRVLVVLRGLVVLRELVVLNGLVGNLMMLSWFPPLQPLLAPLGGPRLWGGGQGLAELHRDVLVRPGGLRVVRPGGLRMSGRPWGQPNALGGRDGGWRGVLARCQRLLGCQGLVLELQIMGLWKLLWCRFGCLVVVRWRLGLVRGSALVWGWGRGLGLVGWRGLVLGLKSRWGLKGLVRGRRRGLLSSMRGLMRRWRGRLGALSPPRLLLSC